MRREAVKRGRVRGYPVNIRQSPSVYSANLPLLDTAQEPVLETKEWYAQPLAGGPKLRNPRGVRGGPDAFFALCPKPTNFSYQNGKCGKARCGCCHDWPVNKPLGKSKGSRKRKSRGDETFYSVDWVLPVPKKRGKAGETGVAYSGDEWESDADDVGCDSCPKIESEDGYLEGALDGPWNCTSEEGSGLDEDKEGWERIDLVDASDSDAGWRVSESGSDGSWERLEAEL